MTRVELQIEGLATMSPAQLRAEWRRVYRGLAPQMTPDLLRRGIAYRLQERVHGGLPPATARQLDRLAEELQRTGDIAAAGDIRLRPGTTLVRHWHDRVYRVLATDDGFLLEDRHYSSLTQIAAAITGTHQSGPIFFGLKKKRSKPPVQWKKPNG